MAEKAQGLDISPEQGINSDQGFQDALAAKGLDALEPEGPAEDRLLPGVLPGDEPSEEAPVEEAGEAEPEVDPAVAEFLAQHGDDPQTALEAALKERENAQSLIGRQGNELGDLRESVARLEGRLDEVSRPQAETPPEPIGAEMVESISTMFEENGADQAMNWLAENRPDLIETGIQVWAEQDPFSAGRFASRYDSFLQEEQARAEVEAEPQAQQADPINDPILAQMRAREQFTMLADGARAQLQIADEAWPMVRDNVVAVFNDETTSPLIKNAIISPDPNTQFEGMKAIVSMAQQRAIQAQNQTAEAQASAAAADEAEQRKLQAQVATGSLRPAEEGKSVEEMSSEERIALFKQSLLEPPSTSVLQGLTGIS